MVKNHIEVEVIEKSLSDEANAAELIDIYDQWAKAYDEDVKKFKYKGPECLMDIFDVYINRKNVRILDVCAGTGAVGKLLKNKGFEHVDGHDGSNEMLAIAQSYGIYRTTFCEIFETDEPSQIVPQLEYDVVVSVGGFTTKMNENQLEKFIDATKPGGKIFFGLGEELETDEFVEKIKELEEENKIKPMCRKVYENYRLRDVRNEDDFTRGVFYALEVL